MSTENNLQQVMKQVEQGVQKVIESQSSLKNFLYLLNKPWDFALANAALLTYHFDGVDAKNLYFMFDVLPEIEQEVYDKQIKTPDEPQLIKKVDILRQDGDAYTLAPLYETSKVTRVKKQSAVSTDPQVLLKYIYMLILNGTEYAESSHVAKIEQLKIADIIRNIRIEDADGSTGVMIQQTDTAKEVVVSAKWSEGKSGVRKVFFDLIRLIALTYYNSQSQYLSVADEVREELASLVAYTYCLDHGLADDQFDLSLEYIIRASETPGNYGTTSFNAFAFLRVLTHYKAMLDYIYDCLAEAKAVVDEGLYNFDKLMSENTDEDEIPEEDPVENIENPTMTSMLAELTKLTEEAEDYDDDDEDDDDNDDPDSLLDDDELPV